MGQFPENVVSFINQQIFEVLVIGSKKADVQVDSVDEEDPPPPLPRGNFTQMHNFLSDS